MSDASELVVLLGRGTRFTGRLAFEGRARVDGEFSGEVETDGVLIVGEAGEVRCEALRVGVLIVRGGTVRGNVVAREAVEVYAPGKVFGNLTAPQVFIDKGVHFEGSCSMTPAPVEAPAATPVEPPRSDEGEDP